MLCVARIIAISLAIDKSKALGIQAVGFRLENKNQPRFVSGRPFKSTRISDKNRWQSAQMPLARHEPASLDPLIPEWECLTGITRVQGEKRKKNLVHKLPTFPCTLPFSSGWEVRRVSSRWRRRSDSNRGMQMLVWLMDKASLLVPFLATVGNGVSRLSEPGPCAPRCTRENPNV